MSITKDTTLPVLIIGGGLAGAALAQILKSHSIPFQIFERDGGPSTRSQGWAVAIVECLPRLTSLLPTHLGDIHCTSVNASISAPDTAAILHPKTGDVVVKLGSAPVGQPGHLVRANRERLRKFLWKDLDVQTNRQFSHYIDGPNEVTAFFTDGTSVKRSLLIGIDGAHSAVRKELLSQTAKPAPFISIIGTVRLSPSEFEPIHAKGSAGVASGDTLRWLLSLLSIEPDRSSATYYYAVCYLTDNPAEEFNWLRTATKSELFDKAVALTTSLPQFFRDVLHKSGAENIHTPPLRFVEFEPPASLPTGRVTLAGDAAHTMMPFKGAGANTAFLDICDLAELLIEAKAGQDDLGDQNTLRRLMKRYESVVLPRGKEMVARSGATGEGMDQLLGLGKSMGATKGSKGKERDAQENVFLVRDRRMEEREPVRSTPPDGCITQ